MDPRPDLEHVDYQCLLGGSSSITATWYGSAEEPEAIAAWYRQSLTDYEEQKPQDWIRHDGNTSRLVIVGPADAWPPDVPRPTKPPRPGLRTLVLESSILRRDPSAPHHSAPYESAPQEPGGGILGFLRRWRRNRS